jgi:hypothetical protein
VRTAPIDGHGVRAVGAIAAPRGDALLDALAPGPKGEAIALLGEPQGAADGGPLLAAARGFEAAGRTFFAAPEAIAEDAPATGATVAVEPSSDRALAAWQGSGGTVYCSTLAVAAGG